MKNFEGGLGVGGGGLGVSVSHTPALNHSIDHVNSPYPIVFVLNIPRSSNILYPDNFFPKYPLPRKSPTGPEAFFCGVGVGWSVVHGCKEERALYMQINVLFVMIAGLSFYGACVLAVQRTIYTLGFQETNRTNLPVFICFCCV